MTSLGQLLICSDCVRTVSFMARAFIYLFFCVRKARKRTQSLWKLKGCCLCPGCVCVCAKERGRVRLFAVVVATEMSRFSFVELLTGTGGTIFSWITEIFINFGRGSRVTVITDQTTNCCCWLALNMQLVNVWECECVRVYVTVGNTLFLSLSLVYPGPKSAGLSIYIYNTYYTQRHICRLIQ